MKCNSFKRSAEYADAWTEGAIYCFNRHCNCTGCYMKDLLESDVCRMKKAVITLVRKFGTPPPPKEQRFTEAQQKIVDAILAGANTYEDIREKTGFKRTCVQSHLSTLYIFAKKTGFVFINGRYKLPEFVEWLRNGELTE